MTPEDHLAYTKLMVKSLKAVAGSKKQKELRKEMDKIAYKYGMGLVYTLHGK